MSKDADGAQHTLQGPPSRFIERPDPAVLAVIAAMRPIRMAAVFVPIIARAEPTVLFTRRTAHLADYAAEIAFPGGEIEAVDASPAAAALREAEEEVSLDRRFVEPIGTANLQNLT